MTDLLNAIVALANFVIVPGLAYGAQLALGALGVTLIYSILRFSNFAHGDTMAFGAMATILVTWWLQGLGVSFGPLPTALLALPIGIAATALLLLATDRGVYRFYRARRAAPTILVIVSLRRDLRAERHRALHHRRGRHPLRRRRPLPRARGRVQGHHLPR